MNQGNEFSRNEITSDEWESLVSRHLCDELDSTEQERLTQLLDSDAKLRERFVQQAQFETEIGEVLRDEQAHLAYQSMSRPLSSGESKLQGWLIGAVAMAAAVALMSALYFWPSQTERKIARIRGFSGPLLWTGDGGKVSQDFAVGTRISGGTIDGTSPSSWFELQFNDGSRVTISGNSSLTFSDDGQKELRLRGGRISANVVKQRPGKPMLIHTQSAMLEVLGTQFEVESELAATKLNVREGSVRLKRLSDGKSVDVSADHQLIATADRDLKAMMVADAVESWKSDLAKSSWRYGDWVPASQSSQSRLKAIPYTTNNGFTIFSTAVPVTLPDKAPVVLRNDTMIRCRGILTTSSMVFFGVTLKTVDGEFAGHFQAIRPASSFKAGESFDIEVSASELSLDPSLKHMSRELPETLDGSVIETAWCHSLDKQVGLAITGFEFTGPAAKLTLPGDAD